MKKCLITLFVLGILVSACKPDNKVEEEIAAIPVSIKIERFDRDFGTAKPTDLQKLKKQYSYLFPAQFPDSVWVKKMKDTITQELFEEVQAKFPELNETEKKLVDLYKHIKYYFPEAKIPKLVTIISEVDYAQKVIETDSLLIIGLDNYLGPDHRFYEGIQVFHRNTMSPENIVSDVASAFVRKRIPISGTRSLLAQMIAYGKELYLKELLLPGEEAHLNIGYTPQDLNWAVANESEVWRYFVEGDLLFSTDQKLTPRFINPAPFSKFYLAIDNESPGMIGRFIGWQIVKSYMENNNTELEKMLHMSADEIFKESKYKPKK